MTAEDDAANIAAHTFDREEREAAQELIAILWSLPDDLQQLYQDVVELHRKRRFADSGAAWELWMEKAREKGLL